MGDGNLKSATKDSKLLAASEEVANPLPASPRTSKSTHTAFIEMACALVRLDVLNFAGVKYTSQPAADCVAAKAKKSCMLVKCFARFGFTFSPSVTPGLV